MEFTLLVVSAQRTSLVSFFLFLFFKKVTYSRFLFLGVRIDFSPGMYYIIFLFQLYVHSLFVRIQNDVISYIYIYIFF